VHGCLLYMIRFDVFYKIITIFSAVLPKFYKILHKTIGIRKLEHKTLWNYSFRKRQKVPTRSIWHALHRVIPAASEYCGDSICLLSWFQVRVDQVHAWSFKGFSSVRFWNRHYGVKYLIILQQLHQLSLHRDYLRGCK